LPAAVETANDVSIQNDSATARAETGKIRGICSLAVPDGVRTDVSTPTPERIEIDRRLSSALYDAGRSALGMPGTVDILKLGSGCSPLSGYLVAG